MPFKQRNQTKPNLEKDYLTSLGNMALPIIVKDNVSTFQRTETIRGR